MPRKINRSIFDNRLHQALVFYAMISKTALLIVEILSAFTALSSVLQWPQNTNDSDIWGLTFSTDNTTTGPPRRVSSLSRIPGVEPTGLQTSVVKCDGSIYGFNLNTESCLEAWSLLPKSAQRRTFGTRTEGQFNVPLPFRVLSCKEEAANANTLI